MLPPADAFVVALATFNMVNKWALGISDTLTLGLREWGVSVILDPARLPGAGDDPAVFPWDLLQAELLELRRAVAGQPRTG